MRLTLGWLCLASSLAAAGQSPSQTPLAELLKGVEDRYNRPKSMQLVFEQSHSGRGRITRSESGTAYFLKPNRMRWDYSSPEGKLFLVDGQFVYYYSPGAARVEKTRVKEADDLRVPLAFLMGRLDFYSQFKEFRTQPEGQATKVVGIPKSDKAPYREVEFLITPARQIRLVSVAGSDGSSMTFRFTGETANPPLPASLFQFKMPPGAELIDMGEQK